MIFHIIKRDTDEIVKSLPNYNGAGPKILNSFEAADFIGILFGFRAKKHTDLLGRGIAGEDEGATIEKGVTTRFFEFLCFAFVSFGSHCLPLLNWCEIGRWSFQ